MHRSWGPLEPYDNSFPEMMREKGIHTHLVTDHLHYFEDGGSTYHTRFRTWEFIRGQEYDPWKAMVQPPVERLWEMYSAKHYNFERLHELSEFNAWKRPQSAVNRLFVQSEEDFPGPQCFKSAFEFLDLNRTADHWFLMVECFDPHEPFTAPERFKNQYRAGWNGGILDWPYYEKATDNPEEIAEIRANYAALVAMCDHYFGKLLDYFDAHDLWNDTALILSTDHGFLLAEHDWWGKNLSPTTSRSRTSPHRSSSRVEGARGRAAYEKVEAGYVQRVNAGALQDIEALQAAVSAAETAAVVAKNEMARITAFEPRQFNETFEPIANKQRAPWLVGEPGQEMVVIVGQDGASASYRRASDDERRDGKFYKDLAAYQREQAA